MCSCCSKNEPKTDEDYHVGLKTIGKQGERENPHFKEKVAQDDAIIYQYLKTEIRDSCANSICCCYGIFSEVGSCHACIPSCCISCCNTCHQLAVLHGHDPRELSHRNSWVLGFEEASKDAKLFCFCFSCCSCCPDSCPIAAIIEGTLFSPCYAKKMRLLALAEDSNPVEIDWICGWFGCSSKKLENYTCCQGYQDRVFIKPGEQLKSCTDSCPELSLNVEACLFPGSSMDSTVQFMMDTRDVKPDPQFAEFNSFIDDIEKTKSLISHIGSSNPAALGATEPVARCLGLYANCLKKSVIAIVVRQVAAEQGKTGGFYDAGMQGRHLENTLTKMSHRVVAKKAYVVKKPLKFYREAMHATDLDCR